jgi:ribosome-associated protein
MFRHLPITERFVRASAWRPNVNKVATAVELRLDAGMRRCRWREAETGVRRLIADDILLIDSREYRTQAQNREAARARLSELLTCARRPKRRQKTSPPGRPSRPGRRVIRGRIKGKARPRPPRPQRRLSLPNTAVEVFSTPSTNLQSID